MSHVLSAEGLTSGLYLQDLRTTLNRAAPKESRGGPINYSDADSGDLVPAVTLSTRQWAAHRRRPSICPPWLGVTTMSQVIQNSPAKHLWTDMGCNAPLWPEIASEAACSGSKRWHPVDGCGPRQTDQIRLRSRRPQVRILPGAHCRGHHLTNTDVLSRNSRDQSTVLTSRRP